MKTPRIQNLPVDLQRVLWKRNILPFLLYLAWIILFGAASLFWILPAVANTPSRVLAPTVCLLLCVLPFFVCRLHKKTVDRSLIGTVRKIEPIAIDRMPLSPFLTGWQIPRYHYCELTIDTDQGKSIVRKQPIFDVTAPPPWKEGDRVIHFKGSPFLLSENDLPTTCILCGGQSAKGARRCVFCNHSLIDPNKL